MEKLLAIINTVLDNRGKKKSKIYFRGIFFEE